ncbi:MAG: response regulator [Bacteroidales bacterium]|jgi:CheY-like chemotaxis protein|nr:response regulator [Bacteroidales bacterium]
MINNIEILIIDDHIETAKAYADLIEIKCQLSSKAVSNIEEAISYVTKCPIKVIVIDQVMPIPGTDMFERLKKLNPYLKAIMVSGEATFQDSIKAQKLGYMDFLHKKDIKELPERIFTLYTEYEAGLTQNKTIPVDKIIFSKKDYTLFKVIKTEYILIDYKVINENFVFESSWKTKEKINKGESKTTTIELQTIEKSIISEEAYSKSKTKFGTNDKLLSGINIVLEDSLSTSYKIEIEKEKKESHSQSIILELDGEEIDGKPVISKNYEVAQVYMQLLLHIKKICNSCGDFKTFPMIIYKPINKIAFRQINYTECKSQKVDTGFLSW